MKKSVMFAISIVMIVSMLAGCAPKATEAPTTAPVEPTTAPGQPTTAPVEPTAAPVEPTAVPAPDLPSEAIVAIGADPSNLGPFVGMSMGRISVLTTMYEYLFFVVGEELTPYVAKSYEQTGDTTFDVTLFDYVTDSAGNKITAADVAWAYNAAIAANAYRPLGDVEFGYSHR